jgi:ketosteroid isomerase-like protein
MSQENVEAVRGVYDQWGRGNFRAGVDLYDPLLLFIPLVDFPAAHHYLGPDGVRDFMLGMLEAWANFAIEAVEFIEAGDSVVVATRWRGMGRKSGALSGQTCFDVWTFRGRAATRLEFFKERIEALEAVGLSEQDAQS